MKNLLENAIPNVTVSTINSLVKKSSQGRFYIVINNIWYGKNDKINGFKSEKTAINKAKKALLTIY